jgi:hypothetical protein
VAYEGQKRNAYRDRENLKEREHFEDLGVDGRNRLKWILKNRKVWTEFIWLRNARNSSTRRRTIIFPTRTLFDRGRRVFKHIYDGESLFQRYS